MLKAIIFDMDGVIIDSEPMHARAAVLALQKYNISITIDYVYNFIGTTTYSMCQKITKDFGLKITAEELLQANDDCKKYLLQEEGYKVIPYVTDLIKNLYQNGIKLIIASSSPSAAILQVMDALQIHDFFHGFVSGDMISHPKPAPDIFLLAASQLKVDPSECLVIEDSYNGVTAAEAAGITSLGFVNPNSGNQDLSKSAMLIEGFDEVDYPFINKVYQHAHLIPDTILETTHIILRELTPQDAKALCAIYNKPEINAFLEKKEYIPSIEAEKLEAYIKNVYHYYGFGLWGIYYKENDCLIGCCGIELKLLNNEEIYELSYCLDPDYQGYGYAGETVRAVIDYSFQQLHLPKIVAVINQKNIRSLQFAEKTGLEKSGNCIRNGKSYYKYEIKN